MPLSVWVMFIILIETNAHQNNSLNVVMKVQYLFSYLLCNNQLLNLIKFLNISPRLIIWLLIRFFVTVITTLVEGTSSTGMHFYICPLYPPCKQKDCDFLSSFTKHTQSLNFNCDVTTEPNPRQSAHLQCNMDHKLRCKLELLKIPTFTKLNRS